MERRRWPVPLSVLDRSPVRHGEDAATAVRNTVEFARLLEQWGYHRFWVAEHHGVPGIAGSAPTVLASTVAARTRRIRVGTGGVMLPNHRPLVVAEQFGTLEALHPGRIDMGLGRSVGFTRRERDALGAGKREAEQFGEHIRELLGYFAGTSTVHPGVHAYPTEGLRVPAFVLATGAGSRVAAETGLALVIASVSGVDTMVEHIDRYRAEFRPSSLWSRPHVTVSVAVAVADTREQARRLLLPEAWSLVYSRTRGVFPPLRSPDDLPTPTEREATKLAEAMERHVYGTAATVRTQLSELVDRTGADEVLVTMNTYDRTAQLDSYRRLAELAR
ncbi:LLM class flavin-dependent oxidoreductase [Saccharomonospora sp. NB11]|jgi:luciferase family oxidoreductase group 1|uniref:LLM class flavin-dependent oxidoreductase n=1 Tax=Saccharomonospora sp. NB11 TaxID=1642298 RepID=UPI0018D15A95|nr:LLM class flavin-dependent oxidoreductase [Saccharomonospora sp. NB11]